MNNWNSNDGLRNLRNTEKTARKEYSGIMFESKPRKRWAGCWQTLNGRVVLRRKTSNTLWLLTVDGKHVGTRERLLPDAISFNEWIIKEGAKKK